MKQNAPRNIALHWDGKLTTDRLGSKYEARFIIASGGGVSDFENGKLLGITKLESSTKWQTSWHYKVRKFYRESTSR